MQGTLINKDIYQSYNKAFYEAEVEGISIKQDFDKFANTDYWERYVLNTFQFSAAKSLAEMKMLQGLVYGNDGKKLPFEDFRDKAMSVVRQFNETWLRVEYDLAARGSVMAERWKEMWKDRDLFPNWIFRTRKDSRVRSEHRDLEGKVFRLDDAYGQQFYPPLDWNCRCEAEQDDEHTALNKSQMEALRDNIAPGFEGNVGIDGIFPITHSYMEMMKNANAAKPQMFGL